VQRRADDPAAGRVDLGVEVGEGAVVPEVFAADHLAEVVDGAGVGHAQVGDDAVLPEEALARGIAEVGVAPGHHAAPGADDLAGVVEVLRPAGPARPRRRADIPRGWRGAAAHGAGILDGGGGVAGPA